MTAMKASFHTTILPQIVSFNDICKETRAQDVGS